MANIKISELSPAGPLDGTELVEVSQSVGGTLTSVRTTTGASAYAARKYGIAFDATDQTFSANTATAVALGTPGLLVGVTVSNTSRINFPTAGVYEVTARLQFQNADSSDHDAKVWFRLSGTDIINSASVITVPKAADGGAATLAVTGMAQITAGQYIECVVAVENANVSLAYTAATASPYVSPAVPSAIITVDRIAM